MLEAVFAILCRPIINRLEELVATVEQLQQQVTEAKDSLQAAIDRVAADVENLKGQLGDQIDPSALDPISQGLADLKANLDALDPVPEESS